MKIRWIHVIIFAALVFYVGGTSLTIESAEQITGFENKDLPVLNEELKRIDSEMSVLVPKGIIALWYGAIDDIPQGWVICDGENDTPDLTDRFIIHADADSGGTNDVADTGGAHSVTLTGAQSGLPIHTHAITTYEGGGGGAAKLTVRIQILYTSRSILAQALRLMQHHHMKTGQLIMRLPIL